MGLVVFIFNAGDGLSVVEISICLGDNCDGYLLSGQRLALDPIGGNALEA